MLEKDRQKKESEQRLYARKDEFAAMKAPFKEKKPYFAQNIFILVKMPGSEYEALGWEKANDDTMKKCLFNECAGRTVYWVKDKLPKDDLVKSVVRADCSKGKKLSDIGLASTIITGAVYSTVCDVSIIDLETHTTVAKSQIVDDKIKTNARDEILAESVVLAPDKKSYLVAPYEKIGDAVSKAAGF